MITTVMGMIMVDMGLVDTCIVDMEKAVIDVLCLAIVLNTATTESTSRELPEAEQ